jgi:hypothetical protein
MSLPRNYEDLTVGERDNVAKRQLIQFLKKKAIQQEIQIEEKEFVENADLESKKKRFIDLFDKYYVLLQNTLDLFLKTGVHPNTKMKTFQNNTIRFYENFGKIQIDKIRLDEVLKSILKEIPINDPLNKKLKSRNELLEKMIKVYHHDFVIQANGTTNFEATGGVGSNQTKADFDDKIVMIYKSMQQIQKSIRDIITYLDSTPRSGKGIRSGLWNIDTTEYMIPHKFM